MKLYMLPCRSALRDDQYLILIIPEEWGPVMRDHLKSLPEPTEHLDPHLAYPARPYVRGFRRTQYTDTVLGAHFPDEDRSYAGDPLHDWFFDNDEQLLPLPFDSVKTIIDALTLAGDGTNHAYGPDCWINEVIVSRDGLLQGTVFITSRDDEGSMEAFHFQHQLP